MSPVSTAATAAAAPSPSVGIGPRHPHHSALLQRRPRPGFAEVHAENVMADGGATLALLQAVRQAYPVSPHGVGLALRSAAGLGDGHLGRLARLVQRFDPVRVSDHAAFARAAPPGGAVLWHANDLLTVAFTEAALHITASNVQRVRDRLQRPILVENLAADLQWGGAQRAQPAFLNQLARRRGCGLLPDVNSLVVNALNAVAGGDVDVDVAVDADADPQAHAVASACAWVNAVNPAAVGEIHLAGDHDIGGIEIDDHGSRVHASVWQVIQHRVQRLGARPTLVEWDTDLPALDVLLDQAGQAERTEQAAVSPLQARTDTPATTTVTATASYCSTRHRTVVGGLMGCSSMKSSAARLGRVGGWADFQPRRGHPGRVLSHGRDGFPHHEIYACCAAAQNSASANCVSHHGIHHVSH